MLSNNDLKHVNKILTELSENNGMIKSELRKRLKITYKKMDSLLNVLEYLDFIELQQETVYIKSNIYSLLYEPLKYANATQTFLSQIINHETKLSGDFTIPAHLMPLLLLRSIAPYFGLIIKDIERDGDLHLSPIKKACLYDSFSTFKFDNGSTKQFANLKFNSDELYYLWFHINKKLISVINTKSSYDSKDIRIENKSTRISPIISIDNYLPINDKIQHINIINKEFDRKDILLFNESMIDIEKLINKISHSMYSSKNLTINLYKNNVIEWIYEDDKGKLPTMIIMKNGIYIYTHSLLQFNSNKIRHQILYIDKIIKDFDSHDRRK